MWDRGRLFLGFGLGLFLVMGQILLQVHIANRLVDVNRLSGLDEVVGGHHFQNGHDLLAVLVHVVGVKEVPPAEGAFGQDKIGAHGIRFIQP